MKANLSRIYLSLAALEGFLALVWIFAIPSEPSSVYILGQSKARLALAAVTAALWVIATALCVRAFSSQAWVDRIHRSLDSLFLEHSALIPVAFVLLLLGLAGIAAIWLGVIASPASFDYIIARTGTGVGVLRAVTGRALPLIVWITVLAFESLLWLALGYPATFRDRRSWDVRRLLVIGLVAVISLLTIAHWLLFIFQIKALQKIPGWYWYINPKSITPRDLIFAALWVALMVTAFMALTHPRATWRNLFLLLVLGYVIQFGIGVADGKGIESLRERYFSSAHRAYAQLASQENPGLIAEIGQYDTLYSGSKFTFTKPPGVMLVYLTLEDMVNTAVPQISSDARYLTLSSFIAWTFPILSLLAVLIILAYTRWISPPEGGYIARYAAPLLFIISPNIVLLGLFLDQALYPSVFLAGTALVIVAIRRRSLVLAALTGVLLYLAVFLSFSMMPLFAFAGLYAAGDYWIAREKRSLLQPAAMLVAFAAGAGVTYFVFRFGLHYDFFRRFQNATQYVYNVDNYQRLGEIPIVVTLGDRLKQIGAAAFLNNVEFATAVGVPAFCLFLVRGFKALADLLRRAASFTTGVQATLFGTYLAMNAYGQTRGEAARLWMFWVPVVVILAAFELEPLIRRRSWTLYLVLSAQFASLVLTYLFQDLRM